MQTILTVVHLLLALGLIGLVLLQHGKGADAGAAFGSGASATVFGSRGSANFLSRATGILAAGFFVTSLALGYFAMQSGRDQGLLIAPPAETAAPVAPSAPVSDLPQPTSDLPQPDAPTTVAPGADVPAPSE